MIGIILRVLACVLFIVAGCDGSLLDQGPADLVAFGLALWVAATLLGGVGPAAPVYLTRSE